MFSYTGKAWLTPKGVRTIEKLLFTQTFRQEENHGNENQGQIGAFSSLKTIGLFDFQGDASQKPTWKITAPIFESFTIHLGVIAKEIFFK